MDELRRGVSITRRIQQVDELTRVSITRRIQQVDELRGGSVHHTEDTAGG